MLSLTKTIRFKTNSYTELNSVHGANYLNLILIIITVFVSLIKPYPKTEVKRSKTYKTLLTEISYHTLSNEVFTTAKHLLSKHDIVVNFTLENSEFDPLLIAGIESEFLASKIPEKSIQVGWRLAKSPKVLLQVYKLKNG